MIGNVLYEKGVAVSPKSLFQPSKEVALFTSQVRNDYQVGYDIQNRGFREFNDLNVLQVIDRDQKLFNSYVAPGSTDPDEAWRYTGIRPITRNKLISIAAHVTANLLIPNVFAQNANDEEDKDAAQVMRDLIEWNVNNSDYETSFLFGVISGLVNPAIYLESCFVESLIEIKEKNAQGTITRKQVIDDVLSGLKTSVVPVDEVFISNAYQFDIQRMRFVGRRSYIDYEEAEALYGDHENWTYVRPGIRAFYEDSDQTFYEQKDDQLETLCERFVYQNRREDCEVVYINGIYLGETNPANNRIKHRDYMDRPKYNIAKGGYEPIDEKRFHYYKSGASKMWNDDRLINTMWQMRMDASALAGFPPQGVSGSVNVTKKVMMPGVVTNFGLDSKITPLTTGGNIGALDGAIAQAEKSLTESSQDDVRQGIDTTGNRTAYEIAKIEQNAKVQLGLFGKMIAKMVEDLGYLMIDNIIQHQTVAEVSEIVNETTRLKFASFLLPEQNVRGRKVTKKISFVNQSLPQAGSQQQTDLELGLVNEAGGINSDKAIFLVNPKAFRNLRFKLQVSADQLLPKNDVIERALKLEAYAQMKNDPYFDQIAVRKDFLLDAYAKGEADKYLSKQQPNIIPQENNQPISPEVKQMTGANLLASMIRA